MIEELKKELEMARFEHRADVEAWKSRFDRLKKYNDELLATIEEFSKREFDKRRERADVNAALNILRGGLTEQMPADMVQGILDAEIPLEAAQYDNEREEFMPAAYCPQAVVDALIDVNKDHMKKFNNEV